MLNKDKLRAKVIENGLTMSKVSEILGINEATLSRKINGISDFSRSELQLLKSLLQLDAQEAIDIFFAA